MFSWPEAFRKLLFRMSRCDIAIRKISCLLIFAKFYFIYFDSIFSIGLSSQEFAMGHMRSIFSTGLARQEFVIGHTRAVKALHTWAQLFKLTTSLVNDSLKFKSSDTQIC